MNKQIRELNNWLLWNKNIYHYGCEPQKQDLGLFFISPSPNINYLHQWQRKPGNCPNAKAELLPKWDEKNRVFTVFNSGSLCSTACRNFNDFLYWAHCKYILFLSIDTLEHLKNCRYYYFLQTIFFIFQHCYSFVVKKSNWKKWCTVKPQWNFFSVYTF